MITLSSPVRRRLIRLCYLLPAISGVILLIFGAVPHFFYLHKDIAYDTMDTFTLVGNTLAECVSALTASDVTADAMLFAYGMTFFVALFWIAILVYAMTSITSAVCSMIAFSHEPTSRESNRAKRWMRFLCPGRVCFVIGNLSILLAAAFPQILLYFYHTQFGFLDMTLHFFGPSDLLLAAILVTINLGSYLALLPSQASEHMDLYRLYKKK